MRRDEFLARFPNASESTIRKNCPDTQWLHSGDSKRPKGKPLERPVPREETRRTRLTIRFTIYAVRPADWDGWHIKELQDCLGVAGIIPGDEWDILQGQVRSEKVHKKEEERTEITIERIQ